MRYINEIYAPVWGRQWSNAEVFAAFVPLIERLDTSDEERGKLMDFVKFQLVGERSSHQ